MKTFARTVAPALTFLLILAGCGGAESAEQADMAAPEEPMTEASDEYMGPNADLVAEFEASGDVLMASLEDVDTAEEWTFRESDDRWNIAEIVEHIVIAENGIVHGFAAGLIEDEPNAENTGDYAEADSAVLAMILDRTNKMQAAPPAEPKGVYETPEEAIAAFDSTRARTIEFLKTTDVDLRRYEGTLNEELVPPMDAYRWLLFAAGHVQRHTKQIEQVKADPNYPTTEM